MTLQAIVGASNLWIPQRSLSIASHVSTNADVTLDAATEETHIIGHCFLPGRTGSKTISSSGGKIHWMVGAATITFANAGTNLRIGIQDVDTANGPPARGDGTHDVYADLVGGTDTLTATTWTSTAMETGSKSITHGDLICIAFSMTARGGADTVKVRYHNVSATGVNSLFPTSTNITAGPTYAAYQRTPICIIEFDDGTFGYIDGSFVTSTAAISTARAFNSGSSPDEYATIFEVPFSCKIDALAAFMQVASNAANFELILYSDPEGTPVAERTVAIDANTVGEVTQEHWAAGTLSSEFTLAANTKYALAIRPTTANNVTVYSFDVAATGHWVAHPLGDKCYYGTRTDQTGAFTTTTTRRLIASVRFSALDDGAGGGGGGGIRLAGAGGLAA